MRVEQIETDLYIAIGDAFDSNSTILLSCKEALVIDALGSKRDAHDLKHLIEQNFEARVRFFISTHYFSDHLAALKLFPDSQIVAHKNYRHTFDQERFRSEEEALFFVEPTILMSDDLTIRWGRFHVNLFYNPAHTTSTINVDIPEADLIHVGDTIVGNMIYVAYSSPAEFFPALERIKQKGRKKLISSHLGPRSIDAIHHAESYLRTLQDKVTEPGSKITLQECLPPGVEGTPFENIFHKRNVLFLSGTS
ncbi:MBL fold metallo-hydrolase [bacterium]|nr:MBL fold metallo-hydrolase [bacterium]